MNTRIYSLFALQIILLVLLLSSLYSVLPLIPANAFLWIFSICVSFPTVTVILLMSIHELYRVIQLP